MRKAMILSVGVLSACTTLPEVKHPTPRRVVTIHNPNVTSEAEVLALAELECQFSGLHAKIYKTKDATIGFFPRIKTSWNCVQ
jgi:hypothetical protein